MGLQYTIPELYGTEDYLCDVSGEKIVPCEQNCVSCSDIACDKNVHTLWTHIGTEQSDAYMAIDLYIELRERLVRLLDN